MSKHNHTKSDDLGHSKLLVPLPLLLLLQQALSLLDDALQGFDLEPEVLKVIGSDAGMPGLESRLEVIAQRDPAMRFMVER